MKMIFLLLAIAFAAPIAARGQCPATLNEAPALLNLRLGMTSPEATAALGRALKINVKREGSFFQNFIKTPAPAPLSGVRALYLRFYDRRIFQIEIFYENRGARPTLDRFADDLAARLNLQNAAWTFENNRKTLNCGAFSIAADSVLNPRVELTDEAARALFLAAQEAERQKNKKKN